MPRWHRPVLLIALLLPSAAAARLELPAFLKTTFGFEGKEIPGGPESDLWFNPLMLLPAHDRPTVQDNTNAYARWGERTGAFIEVAIWRTVNGTATVGVNAVKPHVQLCADYPCGPAAAFLGYDGRRYVQPGADTDDIEDACSGLLRPPEPTDPPALTRALQAAQARVKAYQPLRLGRGPVSVMCVFPQHGTTITVAVLNTEVTSRGRVLPLYYFRFDKVRGTFTPSAQP